MHGDARICHMIELVSQASHHLVQACPVGIVLMDHQPRDDEQDREHCAANGEKRHLEEQVVEKLGPQLQEHKQHHIGKVPAGIELRGAHEHEDERHYHVHGNAEGHVEGCDARRPERDVADGEKPEILACGVVLAVTHVKERGVARDRHHVRHAEDPDDAPEEHDEKRRHGKRLLDLCRELGKGVAPPGTQDVTEPRHGSAHRCRTSANRGIRPHPTHLLQPHHAMPNQRHPIVPLSSYSRKRVNPQKDAQI